MLSFDVNIKHPKNYTTEMITIADFYKKIIPSAPWKMITSSTLQNDNIQDFKNYNIDPMKNDNILYP